MSTQALKLAAIGFQIPKPSHVLQQCEELYIYGVLSQLARFTDLQYRDYATVPDKIQLPATTPEPDVLSRLQQICQSTRSQFLFTGKLAPAADIQSELEINFQLYAAQPHTAIVNETTTLALDIENMGDGDAAQIPIEELNRVINETVSRFIQVLYPEKSPPPIAPMSTSLPAMKLVLKAHRTNNPSEKIALYESAIREDLKIETGYYHLARIYKNEYEFEKSILFFREALKVSQACPRNKALYATEAGIACALLGRPELSLQWWQRAIEYDSSYINPYFNMANVYEDQENYPEAEHYFLKAQELAPDDFRTFLNLARIYSKMGLWDKALTQYRFQLATEDGDPWCHSDVATCYLNLGDVSNAKHHLEKTVSLDPDGEAGQYAQLILTGLNA